MVRFFLLITAIVLVSCQKEQAEPVINEHVLHYDGPNQAAPVLARGISYPFIKFPGSELQQRGLIGESLVRVEYFVDQVPPTAKLLIFAWNANSDTEPGELLHQQEIKDMRNNRWNTLTLDHQLPLPAEGLWIAFEIDAGDNDLRIIGCDPGPRHQFGDGYGLFGNNNEPGWTDFYDFSGQTVNINWNIRGVSE